jgi:hypothetical protein
MSMPKGHKSEFGYATVSSDDGCLGYREIAEIMTAQGDEMNHSTARNNFLRAMEKLAAPIAAKYGSNDARQISQDPRFQSCVQQILDDIYG